MKEVYNKTTKYFLNFLPLSFGSDANGRGIFQIKRLHKIINVSSNLLFCFELDLADCLFR